jgi:Skp family chaperone for outer membrane proteins|tara:strand:- start:96756 stop:97265 length:510 start_codon:yes stop_codon:yes gene_type:complete
VIRQILLATLAASAILTSSAVSAQNIAVVDIQSAILNSAYGQQELERLAADPTYSELVATQRSLQADVDSLDGEARAEASGWDDARFAQYTRTRQFKDADLQLTTQKIQSERERVMGEIINSMNAAALQALEEIIVEEDISLLLRETAVYDADDSHNLTSLLSEKISQQ